jgi:serine/threonine protein kinase HipA of HipAB toxin-antitoxin module
MTDIFEMAWDTLEKAFYDSTDRGYHDDPQQQAEMTPEQKRLALANERLGLARFLDQLPEDEEPDYDNMSREELLALVRRMQEARR